MNKIPLPFMPVEAIHQVFTNRHVKPEGDKYITADIARLGKDKTVILVWHGWKVIDRRILDKSRVDQSADAIKALAARYGINIRRNVIVDEDGVGGGVCDMLNCVGFINNSRAQSGENYANLKAQCYFRLAKRVNDAQIYFPCDNPDIREALTEELEQVKQKETEGENKLAIVGKLTTKKALGRSPDYADALMMRCYFDHRWGAQKMRAWGIGL